MFEQSLIGARVFRLGSELLLQELSPDGSPTPDVTRQVTMWALAPARPNGPLHAAATAENLRSTAALKLGAERAGLSKHPGNSPPHRCIQRRDHGYSQIICPAHCCVREGEGEASCDQQVIEDFLWQLYGDIGPMAHRGQKDAAADRVASFPSP